MMYDVNVNVSQSQARMLREFELVRSLTHQRQDAQNYWHDETLMN